jgi:hypothetical protein
LVLRLALLAHDRRKHEPVAYRRHVQSLLCNVRASSLAFHPSGFEQLEKQATRPNQHIGRHE